MRIQLFLVLTALTGLAFLAANAAPPAYAAAAATTAPAKSKAPVTKAKAKAPVAGSKAPAKAAAAPAKKQSSSASAASKNGKAPASQAASTTRRPATSQAVYSRSNSRTYARGNSAAGRRTTVRSTPNYWQSRPTEDRYREIQQSLADKGFYKGEVNGTWSTESVEALKNFQRAQNLEPDGKLGSLSLIAMGLGPKRIAANATPASNGPGVPAVPPPTPLPSTPPPNPARP